MSDTMIDLRSDTVTQPTVEMRQFMYDAALGDDVFGDDPTVNELQEKVAEYFGAESAIFCPSGTMANQLAIRAHTRPGDEVICHQTCHIYNFEGAGIALNAGASVSLATGPRGLIEPNEIDALVRDNNDPHFPFSRLLAVENTTNKGGGACYSMGALEALKDKAREYGLAYHLDGARLWNALVSTGDNPKAYGELFDTVSVCFSKGLGCPVGSVLLGKKEMINRAYRLRKSMGGGMRQSGMLAAACIYALDNHVSRLLDDHKKAKVIESILKSCSWVKDVEPVETNIIIFYTSDNVDPNRVIDLLVDRGVRIVSMGKGVLRMVTHLGVTDDQIDVLSTKLQNLL